MKYLIIIPARLASTRLPNKPLADIIGQTMISRVYSQALKSKVGEVYVACDGDEIAFEIEKIGGKSVITNPDLPSGTDRIYAALKKIPDYKKFDFIINLQGDLPVIDPKVITQVAKAAAKSDSDITTAASVIRDDSEINNPNVVKIALTNLKQGLGRALYFSRSAIPYSKSGDNQFYHHIGIYVYQRKALEKFVKLKTGDLEKRESLEQLRALENEMTIAVKIVDSNPLSVDTKEDLEAIRNFLSSTEIFN